VPPPVARLRRAKVGVGGPPLAGPRRDGAPLRDGGPTGRPPPTLPPEGGEGLGGGVRLPSREAHEQATVAGGPEGPPARGGPRGFSCSFAGGPSGGGAAPPLGPPRAPARDAQERSPSEGAGPPIRRRGGHAREAGTAARPLPCGEHLSFNKMNKLY
jgi:hypothetical protein